MLDFKFYKQTLPTILLIIILCTSSSAQWKEDWPVNFDKILGLRQFKKNSLILWSNQGLFYSQDMGDTWNKPKGMDSINAYNVVEASDGLYLNCFDYSKEKYQVKRNVLKDGIFWETILEEDRNSSSTLINFVLFGTIFQLQGKLIAFEDRLIVQNGTPGPRTIYVYDTIQNEFIANPILSNLGRIVWHKDTLYYNLYSGYNMLRTTDLGQKIDTLTKERIRRFHIFENFIVAQYLDSSISFLDTLLVSMDRGSSWRKIGTKGRFKDFSRPMKFLDDLYFTNSAQNKLYHFDPINDIILDSFVNVRLVPFSLILDRGLVMGAIIDNEFISYENYLSRFDRNGREKYLSIYEDKSDYIISNLYSFEDTLYFTIKPHNYLYYKKMPNDQNNLSYLGAAKISMTGGNDVFSGNFCVINQKLYYRNINDNNSLQIIDIPSGTFSEEIVPVQEFYDVKRTKDFLLVYGNDWQCVYRDIDSSNWKIIKSIRKIINNHDYIFYINEIDSNLYRINKTKNELIYKIKKPSSVRLISSGQDSCVFLVDYINEFHIKSILFSKDNGAHFQEIPISGFPIHTIGIYNFVFFKNHIYVNVYPDGCFAFDFSKNLWTSYNTGSPSDFSALAIFENELFGSSYSKKLYRRSVDSTFIIKGSVFYDENNNQIKDSTERGLKSIKFAFDQNASIYFSESDGSITTGTDLPRDEIRVAENDSLYFIPNKVSIQSQDVYQQFAYSPPKSLYDLDLKLFTKDVFRPGFATDVYINIKSIYHDLHDIETQFEYNDAKLDFISINIPNFENKNGVIKFKITDILLKSDTFIHITLMTKVNVSINDTITLRSSAITNRSESNLVNNSAELQSLVQGSYDPNDKLTIKKEYNIAELKNNVEELIYTLRCQNDGTIPTSYVIIRDTLDDINLDLSSIQVIGASHPFHVFLQENILVVSFSPLELEPSSINYTKSQAFFSFSIRTKPFHILNELSISNKASIYFDYNLPIETEACVIRFKKIVETKEHNLEYDYYCIYRDNKIFLNNLDDFIGWKLNILNLEGKQLDQKYKIMDKSIEISTMEWHPGIYLLEFTDGSKKIYDKILIPK